MTHDFFFLLKCCVAKIQANTDLDALNEFLNVMVNQTEMVKYFIIPLLEK